MKIRKKIKHIILSHFFIYVVIIILFLFNIINSKNFYDNFIDIGNTFKSIYGFYIVNLLELIDYLSYNTDYQGAVLMYFPTFIGIVFLFLSFFITYKFWKKPTAVNLFFLYYINFFCVSPLGRILSKAMMELF